MLIIIIDIQYIWNSYIIELWSEAQGCHDHCSNNHQRLDIYSCLFQEQSRLGSSFISVPATDHAAISLVISSPRSSSRAFHGGSVHILHPSRKLQQPDRLAMNWFLRQNSFISITTSLLQIILLVANFNVKRIRKSMYKQRGGHNSRCFVTAIY